MQSIKSYKSRVSKLSRKLNRKNRDNLEAVAAVLDEKGLTSSDYKSVSFKKKKGEGYSKSSQQKKMEKGRSEGKNIEVNANSYNHNDMVQRVNYQNLKGLEDRKDAEENKDRESNSKLKGKQIDNIVLEAVNNPLGLLMKKGIKMEMSAPEELYYENSEKNGKYQDIDNNVQLVTPQNRSMVTEKALLVQEIENDDIRINNAHHLLGKTVKNFNELSNVHFSNDDEQFGNPEASDSQNYDELDNLPVVNRDLEEEPQPQIKTKKALPYKTFLTQPKTKLGFGTQSSRFPKENVPFQPYNLPSNQLLSILHHIEPDPASYKSDKSTVSTLKSKSKSNGFSKTKRFKRNHNMSNKLGPGCYRISKSDKNGAIDFTKETGRATLACTLGYVPEPADLMYLQDQESMKRKEMEIIQQVMKKDAGFGAVTGTGGWSVKLWGGGRAKGGVKSNNFSKFS